MGRWWWPPFSPIVHGRNNTEVGGGGNGQRSAEGALTSKHIQNPIPFHHPHHYQLGHNHQRPPPGFLLWLPNGLPASNHPPHPISSQPEVGATLLEPTSDHVPPLLRTLPWYPRHSSKSQGFYSGLRGPAWAWSGSYHYCSSLVSLMSTEYGSHTSASRPLLQLFPLSAMLFPQRSASLNHSPESLFSLKPIHPCNRS